MASIVEGERVNAQLENENDELWVDHFKLDHIPWACGG